MFAAQRISFAKLLLPLALANGVVLALCLALYLGLAAPIKSNNLDAESRRLEIYKQLVYGDLAGAVGDLRLLATGDAIQDYLASGKPADLDRATRRAIFASKDNPQYDQIRYINENGQETFRVNWNGAVVPGEELQDKADRPFFQAASTLAPGQIFISSIDLNVEKGKIERPIKPTLRLAMPLFDAAGRHRGIYIINYRAGNLIDQLRQFVPRRAQRLRLLNQQGYWLAGSSPDAEWGFMLPEHAGQNLAKTDPALWAEVQSTPAGQAPYHGGYFTWERVVPGDFAKSKPVTVVAADDYIVLASVISPAEWNDSLAQLRQTFVAVGALVVVLTTFMTVFFQLRRRAQVERDRFFDLARDMLCTADFTGRFIRVNPACEKTLGYTREEMVSCPYIDFVHPDDREKTILETNRLILGGEVVAFENRYRSKDGTYRWLMWSARPLPEERLIYASARDMTERRQMEEKLRQSEERSRLLVDSVKDYAIFMLAPDGTVMNWNPAVERIMGYKAGEIIGRHFSCFYPPEKMAGKFPELQLGMAAEKGRVEDEGWHVRKDGSRFWANVIITAVRNSQGELIGFSKVTRDVTARKEAAARIQKLNEELKSRAELLEAANKELESFSYSVSHDLRAPLRHIHGFVEILQQSPAFQGQEAAQRQMNVIAKAARDMGVLIDDLLAFSRTSRAEMRLVPVNMGELVGQCLELLEAETAGRRITWEIKPLSPVEGDPALLRLVWANLLGNAVKYTRPRAEAKIEVGEQENQDRPGESAEAVFYVRDNGVGFDMRYAAKLFGVFQRLHRAEDFEGTGIGLANVQRIVHRHGGKVWAESQIERGATFFFSLPVKAARHAHPSYANGKN
jgi:PAS domain S-box-containing protein